MAFLELNEDQLDEIQTDLLLALRGTELSSSDESSSYKGDRAQVATEFLDRLKLCVLSSPSLPEFLKEVKDVMKDLLLNKFKWSKESYTDSLIRAFQGRLGASYSKQYLKKLSLDTSLQDCDELYKTLKAIPEDYQGLANLRYVELFRTMLYIKNGQQPPESNFQKGHNAKLVGFFQGIWGASSVTEKYEAFKRGTSVAKAILNVPDEGDPYYGFYGSLLRKEFPKKAIEFLSSSLLPKFLQNLWAFTQNPELSIDQKLELLDLAVPLSKFRSECYSEQAKLCSQQADMAVKASEYYKKAFECIPSEEAALDKRKDRQIALIHAFATHLKGKNAPRILDIFTNCLTKTYQDAIWLYHGKAKTALRQQKPDTYAAVLTTAKQFAKNCLTNCAQAFPHSEAHQLAADKRFYAPINLLKADKYKADGQGDKAIKQYGLALKRALLAKNQEVILAALSALCEYCKQNNETAKAIVRRHVDITNSDQLKLVNTWENPKLSNSLISSNTNFYQAAAKQGYFSGVDLLYQDALKTAASQKQLKGQPPLAYQQAAYDELLRFVCNGGEAALPTVLEWFQAQKASDQKENVNALLRHIQGNPVHFRNLILQNLLTKLITPITDMDKATQPVTFTAPKPSAPLQESVMSTTLDEAPSLLYPPLSGTYIFAPASSSRVQDTSISTVSPASLPFSTAILLQTTSLPLPEPLKPEAFTLPTKTNDASLETSTPGNGLMPPLLFTADEDMFELVEFLPSKTLPSPVSGTVAAEPLTQAVSSLDVRTEAAPAADSAPQRKVSNPFEEEAQKASTRTTRRRVAAPTL